MSFRRHKMSRGHSKRAFSRGNRVHKRNHRPQIGAMRGGIRL